MPERAPSNLVVHPQEFFREKVSLALAQQKVSVSQDIEYYLVTLLCDFITPEKMSPEKGKFKLLESPLALVLGDALEAPPDKQLKLFKFIGDTSLYLSGYFQDFFNRKTYDLDYYISMGSGAYGQASNLLRNIGKDPSLSQVYRELADSFAVLVEVVAEVSDVLGSGCDENLLALYDRWTRNQSDRLRRKLEDSGITPLPVNPKTPQ